MSTTVESTIPIARGSPLDAMDIVEAKEIVLWYGMVIVAVRAADGLIGVGHRHKSSGETAEQARQRCLDHAVGRIKTMRKERKASARLGTYLERRQIVEAERREGR